MKARRSRLLARLGLLTAALLVALVIAEALLQIGALLVRGGSREAPGGFLTPNRRIVCVGDSNTYGLYVEREEAYPGRLERDWNQQGRDSAIEVLNLGFPGTNSSVVARELPRILRELAPDGVIVLVGANDFWTSQVDQPPGEHPFGDTAAWIRRHSRLYRIVAMLRSRDEQHEVEASPFTPDPTVPHRVGKLRYGEHEFSLGFEGRKQWTRTDETQLLENLERLAAQARASGARLALMTYPSSRDLYGFANQQIRRAAESSGTTLIDLSAAFEESCPDRACEGLFFPDDHPTALGYELIAKTIVQHAPQLLEP